MRIKRLLPTALLGAAAAAGLLAEPRIAEACGGFFCSSPNLPINQAAEKIIFAANADGTVTAVIQIAYQGPAPEFSWLLPISSVPQEGQIGVASNLAFQRLQSATNPRYNLTVRIEGTCRGFNVQDAGVGRADASASAQPPSVPTSAGGVTVEASGTVGAFNYTVISVDPTTADRSEAAVTWLTSNGYSVGAGAPGLIRPYLQDGLHLLALRLSKGASSGSIRPIMITYDGRSPMIPIKLTAVAANADMGVMTWLLGTARGVPQNYTSLELNEARINWFNANSNYNAVVTAAANESTGQGFVTEYAAPSQALANVVWSPSDEARWQSARTAVYSSLQALFGSLASQWGQWDGFWDAARTTVTLPAGITFADLQLCPSCYAIGFSPTALFAALETGVFKPVKDVQALLDSNAYVTRLYTTMSADEMTVDPLFTFNGDLGDVSNVHTAERVIECNPNLNQFEAPWRINLPGGGVIRGLGNQVTAWPPALAGQPSNRRILRMGASGSGAVLEDNAPTIELALDAYNATVGPPSSADAGNEGGVIPGTTADAAPPIETPQGRDASTEPPNDLDASAPSPSTTVPFDAHGDPAKAELSGGGGCSTSSRGTRAPGWAVAAAFAALWTTRRRVKKAPSRGRL